MRAVLQRVSQASVTVDGSEVGRIERGWLILLGVSAEDSSSDLDYRIEQSLKRIELLQSELSRGATRAVTLERRHVLEQQLATVLAEHSGYIEQKQKLDVLAPLLQCNYYIEIGIKVGNYTVQLCQQIPQVQQHTQVNYYLCVYMT